MPRTSVSVLPQEREEGMSIYTKVQMAAMESAEDKAALVSQFTSAQRRSRALMVELLRAFQEQEEAARQIQHAALEGHPHRREGKL